jgi:alkylhydroperoxidase family enzyme
MPRIEPMPWEALPGKERRRMQHTIERGGSPPDKTASRILAYALHDHVPDDGDRHYNYPRHLLPGKLLELLRIRSAQLGGCDPCMNARKVEGVTDEVAACLISPALRGDLSLREQRALAFLDLLATDHHRIDDEVYRALAEVFTTAEIVELGSTCGHMIGTHRFIHSLDPDGHGAPVIQFDPAQVGVSWNELQGKKAAGQKAGEDENG